MGGFPPIFSLPNLDLADVRGAQNTRTGKALRKRFKELTAPGHPLATAPEKVRKHVLRSLVRAEKAAFKDLTAALDHPPSAKDVLHDAEGLFRDWPAPPDIADYQDKLAKFLAKLACTGPAVAEGIANRAKEQHFLAKTLLEQPCEPVEALPAKLRRQLEKLADRENAPSAKNVTAGDR